QAIDDLVTKIGETEADVIVGLGGGSAIDAAKAS
ncbi:iron-containing alcohol dehydrogenase, partial [Bacillus sp. S34]|nr:iron-containing alcohol dehydrogenase [Bacillus sp. S34]